MGNKLKAVLTDLTSISSGPIIFIISKALVQPCWRWPELFRGR